MAWVFAFLTIYGFNFTLWSTVGILRYFTEEIGPYSKQKISQWIEYPAFLERVWTVLFGVIVSVGGFIVMQALIGLFIGSPLTSEVDVQQETQILPITSISLLWFFFAALGGYVTTRYKQLRAAEILVVAASYWFAFVIWDIQRSQGLLDSTSSFVLLILVFLTTLTGGLVGFHVSKRLSPRSLSVAISKAQSMSPEDIAAIIPAHNEEVSITSTIRPLKKILPAENIYVGSDASTDKTVEIARSLGVRVADIRPNRGKAGVLVYMLEHFDMYSRYRAVLFVDADSQIDEQYLEYALPLFDDPEVVAVAGHAYSRWHHHLLPKWSMLFSAYRTRLYWMFQAIMRYGQTWKCLNVTPIVPGFASMYRTAVLPEIDIAAPGLIIEDFNMTFEVHHKRLGKVVYTPKVFATTQDPHTFLDYAKQVTRWNLGFWQTVRRHGIWRGMFWATMIFFLLEVFVASFLFLLLPFVLVWFVITAFTPMALPVVMPLTLSFGMVEIGFIDVLIGVFLFDYLFTVIVALWRKNPMLLIYGPFFVVLRIVDAFIVLYALPLAFITKSEGKWTSPKRQQLQGVY